MFCFKFYLALLSARELTVAVLIQAGGMPEFQVTVKYRKVLKQDHANS
jgi:acid phosphatase family membrane protein YuiD